MGGLVGNETAKLLFQTVPVSVLLDAYPEIELLDYLAILFTFLELLYRSIAVAAPFYKQAAVPKNP